MPKSFWIVKKIKILIYLYLIIGFCSFFLFSHFFSKDSILAFKESPLYRAKNEPELTNLEKNFHLNNNLFQDSVILGTKSRSEVLPDKKEPTDSLVYDNSNDKSNKELIALQLRSKLITLNQLNKLLNPDGLAVSSSLEEIKNSSKGIGMYGYKYVSISNDSGYMEYKGAWHKNEIIILIEPGASIIKNTGLQLYKNLKDFNSVVLVPIGLDFTLAKGTWEQDASNISGINATATETSIESLGQEDFTENNKLKIARKKELDRNVKIINKSITDFVNKNKFKNDNVKVLLIKTLNGNIKDKSEIACKDFLNKEKEYLINNFIHQNVQKVEKLFIEALICQENKKQTYFLINN